MSDVEKLAAKRVERASDNADVRPIDLLRAMANDIESGQLECDGLLIIFRNRPAVGDWSFGSYRCRLTRDEEAGTLMLAQDRFMKRWMGRT